MAKYRIGEASRRLDCFEYHLRALIKAEKIPFTKSDSGNLFDSEDFPKIRAALVETGFKKSHSADVATRIGDMSRPHLATMEEVSALLPLAISKLFRLYHDGKLPEAVVVEGWDDPFIPLDHTVDPHKLRTRLTAEGCLAPIAKD